MKNFIKINSTAFALLLSFALICCTTAFPGMPNPATVSIPNQPVVTVDLNTLPTIAPTTQAETAATIAPPSATSQPIVITPSNQDSSSTEKPHIYLNFENASLLSVINYLGEEKKINIIPHKDLEPVKVTLTTRSPLTFDRAWNVLLTLLEMNGFSLIKVGDLYRVVPSASNGQEPLPTFSSGSGTEPEDLPDNDKVVRYVYFFKNIKVATAKGILSKMMDEKNLIENADLNAVIIKDQCLNIKAAMKIVKELDNGGLRESIEVIALKWANADTIANLFKDILGTEANPNIIRFAPTQQKESAYFSTTTKIIAEPVRNALILLGTQKNVDKIKDFVYKYIDRPIDDAQSRLHVKELRYVQAQDMKPILEGIIKPPKGAGSEKGLVLEGGYKVFEDVIISAETNDDATAAAATASKRGGGNRLIIACNRDDWNTLSAFIDKIDKPQPQVAIEVMIIDIAVSQTKNLNNQLYGFKNTTRDVSGNIVSDRTLARHIGGEFAANAFTSPLKIKDPSATQYINLAPTAANPNNASVLTLGHPDVPGKENIWAIIQAIVESTNAHIIDQPYIIANNNQLCSVSISKTFRVPGQVSSNSTQNVQTQEEIPATIKAEFTPTINLTGTIDLAINLSINEFTQEPTSESGASTRTNRLLVTKTSMGAGEVLVLGGLTSSSIRENLYKTPILGDIPIIGSLFFKSKNKIKAESNLYVFIRPSIIKPRFEGAPDEYTQLKLDYAKYQVMKGDMYVHDTDPIQRWFFKPDNQTIKQKLSDASRGILRPIDNYTYGRNRPKSVDIKEDPYFTVSEAVAKEREERERERTRHTRHMLSSQQVAMLSRPKDSVAAVATSSPAAG